MNEEELEEFRTLKFCYLHDFYGKWVFASCDGYVSCTDRYTTIRLKGIPWKGRNPVNLSFVLRMVRDDLYQEFRPDWKTLCKKECGRVARSKYTGMCDQCFTILVDEAQHEALELLRGWENLIFDALDEGIRRYDQPRIMIVHPTESSRREPYPGYNAIRYLDKRLERLEHPERFRKSPYGRG